MSVKHSQQCRALVYVDTEIVLVGSGLFAFATGEADVATEEDLFSGIGALPFSVGTLALTRG